MKYFVFLPCFLLLLACGSSNPKTDNTDAEHTPTLPDIHLEKSILINDIKLTSNPAHSFALYLPAKYSTKTKSELMIFFDPHGSGAYAIEHYAKLAEEHNCILVGSNNSKNGLNFNETFSIASELVNEIPKILSIDEKHIMFCGFSGGAKVAINAGTQLSAVSKVVYCGAALPIEQCNHPLQLLGFAGIKDMNYSEMVSFSTSQLPSNVSNTCVEWYGKHEWPDASAFEAAFYFLNDEMNKISPAHFDAEKLKLMAQEQTIHQQYIEALHNYDVNYWAREILRLNNERMKPNNNGMADRLIGFISLACYSISNQMIQQSLYDQAGKIITVYKMADPTNPDCDLMQAILYAKENNVSKVFNTLKMAYQNGLKDFSKIENDPTFASYMSMPEMDEIRRLMSK